MTELRRSNTGVKVYVGCGDIPKEDFVNVDVKIPDATLTTNMTFKEGTIQTLTDLFQPESVDLVRAEMVLEHVPIDEIPGVFYQIWTVLRPGGRVELLVPDAERIARTLLELIDGEGEAPRGFDLAIYNKLSHCLLNSFPGMTLPDTHKSLLCRRYFEHILPSEGFTSLAFSNTGLFGWGLVVSAVKGEHIDRPSLREMEGVYESLYLAKSETPPEKVDSCELCEGRSLPPGGACSKCGRRGESRSLITQMGHKVSS